MELTFEHVSGKQKKFAIKDVSFPVKNGYLTGLIGHNGAGKTTLFHYVIDSVDKYEGRILADGQDMRKERTQAMNRIGFISEEQYFFMNCSAIDNVKLCKSLYEEFSVQIFVEQMKHMQLSVNKTLKNMSRGEYLKFQMAFAMAHRSKLYLLDEVTAGMDPVFRKDFFRMIHGLLVEEDVAVLMSTHIEDEIVKHMDYVAELENGALVSFGKVEV